ncbi:MAG: hypothetical protein ABEJ83_01125 [Candidatus Nanohaloarchaea archaeon]
MSDITSTCIKCFENPTVTEFSDLCIYCFEQDYRTFKGELP